MSRSILILIVLVGIHPERIQDLCLDFDLVDIWRVRNRQLSVLRGDKKSFYSKKTRLLDDEGLLSRGY